MNNKIDIALEMVKQIANKHIDVQNTWDGRSAQRYWYLVAKKALKDYEKEVKRAYKKMPDLPKAFCPHCLSLARKPNKDCPNHYNKSKK